MMSYSLSRRQWVNFRVSGCGCVLGASAAFSQAASPVPPGYTPPQPVTDLTKAPGMRAS